MKAQNILRAVAYTVTIAVAVLFYVQSQKAVALLNAPQTASVQPAVPAPPPTVAPAPPTNTDLQAAATRQYEAMEKELAKQAALNKAALAAKSAAPAANPAPKPTPHPAYSFAAPGPQLMPLEGWVDQPNKDRPGRVHTNLMVRHVKPSAKPRSPGRAPCLVMTAKPAERIEREYGWLEVPARTIPMPCGG